MYFKDRTEVGRLLATKLEKHRNLDVIVYALPRGGVVTAVEIAKYLHAPLDLILTRKIGHPYNPEYALAAISESGQIVGNHSEFLSVNQEWLRREIEKQLQEIQRRREIYLHGREATSPEGKIAILVDDGVATGFTLRAGIKELKHYYPRKLLVAIPVVPRSVADILEIEADKLIALKIPSDDAFLGAVGAYYDNFRKLPIKR